MRAEYDSQANAISIDLEIVDRWEHGVEVHPRSNVAITNDRPVNIELLYPDDGIEEPLTAVAERYQLDAEALIGAAKAAVSAPDRPVAIEVLAKQPA